MHKSVGVVIKNKKEEILMIERVKFPFGWACPAGHIDDGEKPEVALLREVREEIGLEIENIKLLIHEFVDWNKCSRGVVGHDWYLFEAQFSKGDLVIEQKEVKNFQWVSQNKLKNLQLEEVWKMWFEHLGYLRE
jgi:8-oxo-dGTP pyrophosphatase MutT (NUDIX family)